VVLHCTAPFMAGSELPLAHGMGRRLHKRGSRLPAVLLGAGGAALLCGGWPLSGAAGGSTAFAALAGGELSTSAYGTAIFALGLCVFYSISYQRSKILGAAEANSEEPAPFEGKKPRIDAFDSLRFFLIFYIASGHFIATATKNALLLNMISQINVVVGAFFVLSGYVAAYTTTELGQRKGSKRLDNSIEFAVSRIMGFWPLHMFVLVVFLPMFFWVDASYSGPLKALWNGFLSTTLLQAWFPLSAEVWNAPTWFLSAFSFCLFVLPYALRFLATQKKAELRKALVFLTFVALIPRLSYSYDLKAWGLFEGTLSAKTHPNYALFNALRFSPFAATCEVLMGAVACRLVMLDSGKATELVGSSVPVLLAMVSIIALRAVGVIALNDMLVRSLAFIPLWVIFLMRIHRESVGTGGPKALPKMLCNPMLQFLGGISFPIFILHGPIGQLFYKKAVVMKVFGQPLSTPLANGVHWFFGVYWIVVLIAATLVNKFFLPSSFVKNATKNITVAICGMFS